MERHGAAVIIAACIWSLAIVAFGFAPTLTGAVLCLAVAGPLTRLAPCFEEQSGMKLFRANAADVSPSMEIISFSSDPMPGGMRGLAGWLPFLLAFWSYRAERKAYLTR